jgi:hypothetical protein
MAFPVPGDIGVQGWVDFVNLVPDTGQYAGLVSASAALYGTPDAYCGSNPLEFPFTSATEFVAGDYVAFDVVAGADAPIATNIRLV